MHVRVEVPFQIDSTAKCDMKNNKNTYFKGFLEFTLINFSCNFCTTFHKHCVWRFIFKKCVLPRTNNCMVQNHRRLLRITYRKNRESHEVGLNIGFLKGIIFRRYIISRILRIQPKYRELCIRKITFISLLAKLIRLNLFALTNITF